MKLLTTFALTLLLSGLCVSTMLSAQPSTNPPCGGKCLGHRGGPYDPKTVETLSGEVVSVDKLTGPRGGAGVHVTLKTDKAETVAVHLGPAWYLDKQSLTVKQGDKLTVRGSRVSFDDKPAIIAAEVTKEGQTLRLRDEKGVPVWAGGPGRRR